jgi:hypothetical protein
MRTVLPQLARAGPTGPAGGDRAPLAATAGRAGTLCLGPGPQAWLGFLGEAVPGSAREHRRNRWRCRTTGQPSECAWIGRDLEQRAQGYAIAHVVPEHLEEVRSRKLNLIAKTEAAVKDRLTKEISYWDHRAEQLKVQEAAGKPNARLNSGEARKRADALQARLEKRMEDLKLERQIAPLPPVVLGGLLVVPAALNPGRGGRVVRVRRRP